jgi:hypothetical protein
MGSMPTVAPADYSWQLPDMRESARKVAYKKKKNENKVGVSEKRVGPAV